MTQASQGYAGRRRLGKPGFDPPPGIRTVEDITAKCPGCGGNAYVEEFESYRPDQAALVKRITRCAKLQWKERCAPTTEIIEKESTTVPLISSELKARYLGLDKTTRKKKIMAIPGIGTSANGFIGGSTRLSQDKIDKIEAQIAQIEAEQKTPAIDVEPAPLISPIDAEPAPLISPIDAEPEPLISPIDAEPAPLISPIDAEPAPLISPIDAEPEPLISPIDAEPAPLISPIDAEPEPLISPIDAEPAPLISPIDVEPPSEFIIETKERTLRVDSESGKVINTAPKTESRKNAWQLGNAIQMHLDAIATLMHLLEPFQRQMVLDLASANLSTSDQRIIYSVPIYV
jgi:hypothetical protein